MSETEHVDVLARVSEARQNSRLCLHPLRTLNAERGERRMAVIIAQVYRYPVNGLSAEPLDRVALAIGRCIPQDRRFAIALGSSHFDPAQPKWLRRSRSDAARQLHGISYPVDAGKRASAQRRSN